MPLAGGQGGSLVHTEIGSSVNPIATRGADYAHHITASPPGFENPAASLFSLSKYFTKSAGNFFSNSLKKNIPLYFLWFDML